MQPTFQTQTRELPDRACSVARTKETEDGKKIRRILQMHREAHPVQKESVSQEVQDEKQHMFQQAERRTADCIYVGARSDGFSPIRKNDARSRFISV